MADDELLIPIDKAFWPRGVARGLAPELRSLGEKHGNIVIVAQQAKGVIMVKGAADKIEEAKPGLRAIIEEQFPDAPMPEELGGDGRDEGPWDEEGPWEEEAPAKDEAPAEVVESPPEPPAPKPPPPKAVCPAAPAKAAPAAPARAAPPAPAKGVFGRLFGGSAAASAVPEPATGQPPVSGRKRPRPPCAAPPDLLWECVKNTSSFIRHSRESRRPFSAEPHNLVGLHAFKYCGLAANEALNVRPVKNDAKESIELVQSHAKPSRHRRPCSALVTVGLSKCPKHGLLRLDREIDAKFYRRGMHGIARLKYLKVQQSFKKRKRAVKSRRSRA